jgi:hypothetical protein
LGDALLFEVLSAADRIARFPEAWHPLGEGVRRCRLSRAPKTSPDLGRVRPGSAASTISTWGTPLIDVQPSDAYFLSV